MGSIGLIVQVFSHRFPSGLEVPVMDLREPVAGIADRLGLIVERWEEDGLGPASGFLVRLSSGRIVLLQEMEHAVKRLGAKGPTVLADAGEVAAVGPAPIASEIVEGLDLSADAVKCIAPSESQQQAADLVARVRAYYAKLTPP
jgi:hypothetical protein